MKRGFAFLTLAAFLSTLSGGCAGVPTQEAPGTQEGGKPPRIEAVEFPELMLIDRSGQERRVKLLTLQGRTVTMLPFPYWQMEPEEIDLAQIRSLGLVRYTHPTPLFLLGMTEVGFILVGVPFGATGDYGKALGFGVLSALGWLAASFFVLLTEPSWSLSDDADRRYNLGIMNEPAKVRAILQIMGVR